MEEIPTPSTAILRPAAPPGRVTRMGEPGADLQRTVGTSDLLAIGRSRKPKSYSCPGGEGLVYGSGRAGPLGNGHATRNPR